MKRGKFFFVVLLSMAACIPSWAQITFSSWGRVVITPYAFSGDYSAVSAATSTWGDAPSIGFSANGTAPSGNIGFNLDFNFGIDIVNNNNIAIIGDNAKAWVYPLGLLLPDQYNMLKLVAGWFQEDELRGKIGATEFGSWVIPNGSRDEDNIFTRLKATAGAYARLEPLKWWDSPWNGLTFHAVFGSNAIGANGNGLRAILNLYSNEANQTENRRLWYDDLWGEYDGNRNTSAADVYRAGQYALGYRIPDVGLFRAQFIGSNRNAWRLRSIAAQNALEDTERQLVTGISRDATKSADVLEFAFLYDGLEGLRVDAGVKIPLEYRTDITFAVWDSIYLEDSTGRAGWKSQGKGDFYTVKLPNVIAVGANWKPVFFPALNIMTRFDISFGGKTESDDGMYSIENGIAAQFWLVPSYRVIDNLTVGLDFGIDIRQKDKIIRGGEDLTEIRAAASEYTDVGFAPWAELGVGGGKVRAGVVVMIPGSPRYKTDNTTANTFNSVTPKFLGDPVVSFPISITYSF